MAPARASHPFVQIDVRLLHDKALSDLDLRVLALLLADTRVKDGRRTAEVSISVSNLARTLDKTRNTIRKSLGSLAALDLVAPSRSNGKKARHILKVEQYLAQEPGQKITRLEKKPGIENDQVGNQTWLNSDQVPGSENDHPSLPQNQYRTNSHNASLDSESNADAGVEPDHGLNAIAETEGIESNSRGDVTSAAIRSDFYRQHGLGIAPADATLAWVESALYDSDGIIWHDNPTPALLAEWRERLPQVIVAAEMVILRAWYSLHHGGRSVDKPIPYVQRIVQNGDVPTAQDRARAAEYKHEQAAAQEREFWASLEDF